MTIQINGTSGISGVDGSAGTPALQGSDSNTGISFGTDEVNINTGGITRATVDSSGRLLVGTTIARTNLYGTSSSMLQLENIGNSNILSGLSCISGRATSTSGGTLILGHHKTGSVGGNTSLGNNDLTGVISFQGADGTNLVQAATIEAYVDGTPAGPTPGPVSMPGRLVFSTTADGASSPTERFRIGSAGQLGIGGANYGTSGQVLTSGGAGAAPTWSGASSGLGSGQTWTNVASSRTTGTTYTNSTGRSIFVVVTPAPAANLISTFNINGSAVGTVQFTPNGGGGASPYSYVIPAGATYSVTNGGNFAIGYWWELR